MKRTIGYTYNCRNCNKELGGQNFFIEKLNPINFDYLIKTCSNCKTKYLSQGKDEFFTIEEYKFVTRWLSSMLIWGIIIFFFIAWIENTQFIGLFFIIFVILYSIIFRLRWDKAIKKSEERLNDEKYIMDLLLTKILKLEDITAFYRNGIIKENIYNKVISNFNANI